MIKGTHTHYQTCADALRRNRITEESKKKLFDYFDDGFSPAQAKKLISDKILSNDNFLDLADNKTNPTHNTLHYQHKKWSKKCFGDDPLNPLEKVREKLDNGYYKERGLDL